MKWVWGIVAVLNLIAIVFYGFQSYLLGELAFFILMLILLVTITYLGATDRPYALPLLWVFGLLALHALILRWIVPPSIGGILTSYFLAIINLGMLFTVTITAPSYIHERMRRRVVEYDLIPKIKHLQENVRNQIEPWPGVVEASYPGNLVASNQGKMYHLPTCLMAQKIPKQNRVWFNTATDAAKKYKKHTCVTS